MSEQMTEHHKAEFIPAIAVLNFIIPDDVQRDIVDAWMIGAQKYREPLGAELAHDRPIEYYWGAFRRHLAALRQGEIYDKKDGHKHVAALIMRLFQIGAILNETNDPDVEGFGIA